MKKGDTVQWNFGKGKADGKLTEVFTEPVKRKIKGTEVKRNASKEEPAYLITQDNGNKVLKKDSEVKKGKK